MGQDVQRVEWSHRLGRFGARRRNPEAVVYVLVSPDVKTALRIILLAYVNRP